MDLAIKGMSTNSASAGRGAAYWLSGLTVAVFAVCFLMIDVARGADDDHAVDALADRLTATSDVAARAASLPVDPAILAAVVEEFDRRAVESAQQGKLDEARLSADLAMEVAARENRPGLRARALLAQGVIRTRRAQYAEAESDYRAALDLFRTVEDRRGEGDARNRLGKLFWRMAKYPEAVVELDASIALARESHDVAAEARGRLNLGEILRNQGKFDEALVSLELARELFEQTGDRIGVADADGNAANVHLTQGNTAEAAAIFERNLTIYREKADENGIAQTLGNLGVAYELTGRYQEALALHRESLALRRAQGARHEEAMVLSNIGILSLFSGRPREAIAYFDQSNQIAEEIDDRGLVQMNLQNSGEALRTCGEFGPALRRLLAALDLARALQMRPDVAMIRGSIASVYQAAGQLERAKADFTAVLEEFRELDMVIEEAITRNNLADVYKRLGQHERARELLEQALQLQRGIEEWNGAMVSLESMAKLELADGNLEQAAAHFGESRDIAARIGDRAGEGRAIAGLAAVAVRTGRLDEARDGFARAFEQGLASEMIDLVVAAGVGLGDVHRSEGRQAEAAAAYRGAIDAIEKGRASFAAMEFQVGFFENNLEPYHRLAGIHIDAGRAGEAWSVVEQARARSLAQLISGSRVSSSAVMTPAERESDGRLRERLDLANMAWRSALADASMDADRRRGIRDARDAARRAYDDFITDLRSRHPQLVVRDIASPPLDPSVLAPLLRNTSAAVLEYVVSDDLVCAFAARRDEYGALHMSARRLEIPASDLRVLAQELLERCERRSPTRRLDEVRSELFSILLSPVADEIAGIEVVGVLPDDVLWTVPFAALLAPDGSTVLDRHAIYLLPSAGVYDGIRRARQRRAPSPVGPTAARTTLLAVANPDLGPATASDFPLLGGLDAIPGTERQAREIASLFSGNALLFLGGDATESRARAESPRHRLLHFATHGIFDSASPLHSGLMLAPGADDDGFLEAREIMELDLNADLVVLSACRTARGGTVGGEGLWGMSWALLAAGATSSVLTQWSVADESTAECMIDFYRRVQPVLSGGAGAGDAPPFWKARCLREAQLALREREGEDWAHLFFWAPFVLVGDPE